MASSDRDREFGKVPKLMNTNYLVWCHRQLAVFNHDNLWAVIECPKPGEQTSAWNNANKRAISDLLTALSDNQMLYIETCDNAKETWKALKKVHLRSTIR